jgi:acyl-CoA thioesterase YciA
MAGEGTAMTDTTANEPLGTLTIRTLAMPADTNPAGDIFGGWVMSQMDIAGAIAAVETARGRVVTVAVEAMTFIAPVKVGDILCVYTRLDRVGTTSITIAIEAWARRNRVDDRVKVTDGRFVYVSLGEDGRKRPIPR